MLEEDVEQCFHHLVVPFKCWALIDVRSEEDDARMHFGWSPSNP